MQECAQKFKNIRKLAKAQKVEIKMLKRQLQEIEVKSNRSE